MKTAEELKNYTFKNMGPMRKWCVSEIDYMEQLLKQWITINNIGKKTPVEIINNSKICLYELEGLKTLTGYEAALYKCKEQFTYDVATIAVDLALQELAQRIYERTWSQYPQLQNLFFMIVRFNKFAESIMYIGPYYHTSSLAYKLFCDDGVFMTQGLEECKSLFHQIQIFS